MTRARRIAGGVLTLGGVGILCTLGTWQVQRLQWKNDIIARLEIARAAPQTFSYGTLTNLNAQTMPLAYGSVRGMLLSAKEVLIGPVPGENGAIGYNLVMPLALEGGDGNVLIHLGWIDEAAKDAVSARAFTSPVPVTFTGIVRRPDYNRFSSGNNPAGNQWMRLDPAQIGREKNLGPTSPLVLYAERADRKFDAQRMNQPGWAPRNNHKQYAIFWYTMAAVLCGFYLFILWRGRKKAA